MGLPASEFEYVSWHDLEAERSLAMGEIVPTRAGIRETLRGLR